MAIDSDSTLIIAMRLICQPDIVHLIPVEIRIENSVKYYCV